MPPNIAAVQQIHRLCSRGKRLIQLLCLSNCVADDKHFAGFALLDDLFCGKRALRTELDSMTRRKICMKCLWGGGNRNGFTLQKTQQEFKGAVEAGNVRRDW